MRSLFLFLAIIIPTSSSAADTLQCIHPNGAPYAAHWEACQVTVFQWSVRALHCEAALSEARRESLRCDFFSDFIDGPGGRVWKPASERAHKPVFLLEPRYCGKINALRVIDEVTGREIPSRYRTCSHNENRYHHDVLESVNAPVIVHVEHSTGDRECIYVAEPWRRND